MSMRERNATAIGPHGRTGAAPNPAPDPFDPTTIRFGLHSGQQYDSVDEPLYLWQRAESLGYDWVSLFDHLRPPLGGPAGNCLEGTTLLAALATQTSRVRCAMLVSPLTWRHPAVLAMTAATIDHISKGRLELGIGAGGPDLAYRQYGIPLPDAGTRVDLVAEGCHIMRRLWEGGPVDHAGEHFTLTGACLAPQPIQRRLPLLVGGEGPRLLRAAARHADGWNTLAGSLLDCRQRDQLLADACADVGRDPATIRRSVTFRATLAETRKEALRRAESLPYPPGSPVRAEYLLHGTVEDCAETLAGYIELGVRDFLLGARPPIDWETVAAFAEGVIPLLRPSSTRRRNEVTDADIQ
jgi:alkanesulfonate monooxygenase SsuD/methylene tetrahydromethanopterin reductase-like flavin-dependent oxidoreductase (luciferase family)